MSARPSTAYSSPLHKKLGLREDWPKRSFADRG